MGNVLTKKPFSFTSVPLDYASLKGDAVIQIIEHIFEGLAHKSPEFTDATEELVTIQANLNFKYALKKARDRKSRFPQSPTLPFLAFKDVGVRPETALALAGMILQGKDKD
jgi:hypothetical protein